MKTPFDRIRARFLLPWLAVGAVLSFAPGELLRSKEWLRAHPDDPLPIAVGSLLISSLIFVVPSLYAWVAGLSFRDLYGTFPSRREFMQLAIAGISSVGLSAAVVYLVFVPLSMVAPNAVQSWLFDGSISIYSAGPPYPFLPNLVSFFAVVLAAPVAEEWFVRGLLLGRWSRTVGTFRAVIRTSILFGLLHHDIVGALLSGVILCGVYAHYRSLWAPTILHASNNFVAWVLEAVLAHGPGAPDFTTVADLRAAWWLLAGGLLTVLPWAIYLRGKVRPFSSWQFPAPGARPARWWNRDSGNSRRLRRRHDVDACVIDEVRSERASS